MRLDANGELEEGQPEPPEGPLPALEEDEPPAEEVVAAAAGVAARCLRPLLSAPTGK